MKYGLNSLAWISPFTSDSLPLLKKARDMGFDVFEIAVEDPATIDTDAIKTLADELNLEINLCGAFGERRDVSSDDAQIRKEGVEYLKTMVDIACKLNSRCIVGPLYSAVGKARQVTAEQREQAMVWATENIKEVALYAKEKCNVKFGIEPLNRFETDLINTAEQAQDLVERINMDNVGYLLDTFHMNIEENNIPKAILRAKGKLVDFHTCANDRGTPGKDNFNWEAIKSAIKEIGYDGPLIIESFTPDCKEIAKAASVWRKFAESPELLASEGIKFLKATFE